MRTAAAVSVLALLLAVPAAAEVIINEIDYDQVGTDAAEYIELKNTGPGSVDLNNYAVELVNGTGGGAAIYKTINFPPATMLAANDYFVICGNSGNVPNCDMVVTPATDLVQNGAPDAVGVRNLVSTLLVDAVSYEGSTGAPYIEGTGFIGGDDNVSVNLAIVRFPDGVDTNNNNADWRTQRMSPGLPNTGLPGSNPLSLGLGAAALALLGGIAVMSRRRRAVA